MFPKIFIAIDTTDLAFAEYLSEQVYGIAYGIKIGLEFFVSHGADGIIRINKHDMPVFLDLKFHDIPNTVAGAVRSASTLPNLAMLTVHASGGTKMMQAAKNALSSDVLLVGVSILTSLDEDAISEIGHKLPLEELVALLADCTSNAGLDGLVCSAYELPYLRNKYQDRKFKLIVPGIKTTDHLNDQKRTVSPAKAVQLGADYLVIGRAVTKPDEKYSPREKLMRIYDGL